MSKGMIGYKIACIALLAGLAGCSPNEQEINIDSKYTGNEAVYALTSASAYNMSGTVTFRERKDNSTDVEIALNGIKGTSALFPVHLHLGDVVTDDAAIAAMLQPVDDKTGKSLTNLRQLADESSINFTNLTELDACIKIHLSFTGEAQNVILAAGNIGSAVSNPSAAGRTSIGVCRSGY